MSLIALFIMTDSTTYFYINDDTIKLLEKYKHRKYKSTKIILPMDYIVFTRCSKHTDMCTCGKLLAIDTEFEVSNITMVDVGGEKDTEYIFRDNYDFWKFCSNNRMQMLFLTGSIKYYDIRKCKYFDGKINVEFIRQ